MIEFILVSLTSMKGFQNRPPVGNGNFSLTPDLIFLEF